MPEILGKTADLCQKPFARPLNHPLQGDPQGGFRRPFAGGGPWAVGGAPPRRNFTSMPTSTAAPQPAAGFRLLGGGVYFWTLVWGCGQDEEEAQGGEKKRKLTSREIRAIVSRY